MKVLIGILVAILIIAVLLGIAFVIVINLTPDQLGLGGVALGDKTIDELGLGNTKIIDIYKSIKNIGNTKEEDVVENPVNKEEEKSNASDNMEGSVKDYNDDYSSVAVEPVVYDVRRLVSYDDTTIAYILDNIVQHADAESSDEIKALKDANLSVKELTITKDSSGAKMRVVSYMDLTNYQDQIKEALGSAASILPIPKQAYLVSEFSFTVETGLLSPDLGKMITTPLSISINGNNDDPVSKAILEVMGNMTGEDINSLNGKLGEAVAQVVGNLGQIGTASTVGSTNVVVALSENYGMSGVENHKLTIITYGA